MHKLGSLAAFLVFVMVTAALRGQFTAGDWYYSMIQPAWNPPAMVMASVWAVLYVLMAVSAWMVWEALRGLARAALTWWSILLLLGVCWSWVFFALNRTGWALAVMSLWLLAALMVIRTFRSIKPEASSLMWPVAVWLVFCWLLNFMQWHLNGGGLGSIF